MGNRTQALGQALASSSLRWAGSPLWVECEDRRDPVFQFVNAVLDQVVTNQSHVAALSDEVQVMNMQEDKCRL